MSIAVELPSAPAATPDPSLDGYAKAVIRFKARQVSKTPPFTPSDVRDIEQELTMSLLVRMPQFDPDKGKWGGFVQRVVHNRIADMIREATSQRNDRRANAFSLNELVVLPDGEVAQCHELLDEVADTEHPWNHPCPTELRIDLFLAIDTLPENLRVVCLRLQHESVQDIARSLGRSREAIYRRLYKASVLLERAGLREYLPKKNQGDTR